jgi:DNA-binding IclR family transcriptional regulator
MLSDGKWHTLEEIQERTVMDEEQVLRIVEFLKEYDFVMTDEAKNKIKLNKMTQRFLAQTTTA